MTDYTDRATPQALPDTSLTFWPTAGFDTFIDDVNGSPVQKILVGRDVNGLLAGRVVAATQAQSVGAVHLRHDPSESPLPVVGDIRFGVDGSLYEFISTTPADASLEPSVNVDNKKWRYLGSKIRFISDGALTQLVPSPKVNCLKTNDLTQRVFLDFPDGEYIKIIHHGYGDIVFTSATGTTVELSPTGFTHSRDRTDFKVCRDGVNYFISHLHDEALNDVQKSYPIRVVIPITADDQIQYRVTTSDALPYNVTYPDGSEDTPASNVFITKDLPAGTTGEMVVRFDEGVYATKWFIAKGAMMIDTEKLNEMLSDGKTTEINMAAPEATMDIDLELVNATATSSLLQNLLLAKHKGSIRATNLAAFGANNPAIRRFSINSLLASYFDVEISGSIAPLFEHCPLLSEVLIYENVSKTRAEKLTLDFDHVDVMSNTAVKKLNITSSNVQVKGSASAWLAGRNATAFIIARTAENVSDTIVFNSADIVNELSTMATFQLTTDISSGLINLQQMEMPATTKFTISGESPLVVQGDPAAFYEMNNAKMQTLLLAKDNTDLTIAAAPAAGPTIVEITITQEPNTIRALDSNEVDLMLQGLDTAPASAWSGIKRLTLNGDMAAPATTTFKDSLIAKGVNVATK